MPLKVLLTETTSGNPLFLEESVRTLVETRALFGSRGAYRLVQPVEAIQVPATVQSIIASRIDRLPQDEKRLLQSAAVVGKDVPFGVLQNVAGMSEDDLRRGLAHLQSAEFLYETNLFPEPEYTFKHALTHDVAYGSLLHDRQRDLHAKVVATIEALYAGRLNEQIERLAHHAFRGEVWGKAVDYLRQAGAKAFARSANRETVAYLDQALIALSHVPEARTTLEHAIDIRFDLRSSLFPLGELDAMLAHLRDAERIASAIGDHRRMGWIWIYLSQYHWVTGRLGEARAFGERAKLVADTLSDSPLQAVANYYTGAACFSSTAYKEAASFLRAAISSLDGALSHERFGLAGYPAVMARWLLASTLAERGEFDEGMRYGQEALRIGDEVRHPYSLILACWGVALLFVLKGELSQASAQLERAIALCREWNVPVLSPITGGFLGYVQVLSGRVTDGLATMQERIKEHDLSGLALYHSRLVVWLAEALMRADRLDDAVATAERAIALTRERGEPGLEAWAVSLLGDVSSRRQTVDVAATESYYRKVIELADEMGLQPLLARCHSGLGRLYRRVGRREEAEQSYTTSAAMYRRMNARVSQEQVEAEVAAMN